MDNDSYLFVYNYPLKNRDSLKAANDDKENSPNYNIFKTMSL